ncbi:MAG: 30S ribosome-binding factor RbfA [Alphaproteobacteria bacterium]|nr:30S ribosome-binding factor RbfA [Alphaproteobacteria bacterium]
MKTMIRNHSSLGPSQRQRRVGEEVRKILSSLMLQGEIRNEVLYGVSITVTEVRMSVDLKHAFIFVMPLGGKNLEGIVVALTKIAPFLRSHLSKSLSLRTVPILHFEPDRSYDEAEKIDKLLKSDRVVQDLFSNKSLDT